MVTRLHARRALVLLVAAATAVGLGGPPSSGAAVAVEATGSISGTVLPEQGVRWYGGPEVSAHSLGPSGWVQVARTLPDDVTGDYTLDDLPPGTYRVRFGGEQDEAGVLTEWYDDAAGRESATDVEVAAGATTDDVDATLAPQGSISGTVTDAAGRPVAGLPVTAGVIAGRAQTTVGGVSQITDDDGTYRLRNLAPGVYTVGFGLAEQRPGVRAELWPGVLEVEDAVGVVVQRGQPVTAVDASLERPAVLEGVVRDAEGRVLRAGVTAFREIDGEWRTWARTETRDDGSGTPTGRYRLPSLPGGEVRICAGPRDGLGWCWPASPDVEGASSVAITAGRSRLLDLTQPRHGTLTGRVTRGGASLESGVVEVLATRGGAWRVVDRAHLDATRPGVFERDVLPGRYRLHAVAEDDGAEEYSGGAASIEQAQDVVVAAGAPTEVDLDIDPPGTASGSLVWAGDWEPRVGVVDVVAHRRLEDGTWRRTTAWGQGTAEGGWRVGGLRAGTYRFEFTHRHGETAARFWPAADRLAEGEDVVVATDGEVTGLDVGIEQAAHLLVTPISAVSDAVRSVEVAVQAVGDDGLVPAARPVVVTGGRERVLDVGGLAAGTYRLVLDPGDPSWRTFVWNGAESAQAGEDLVLATGQTRDLGRPVIALSAEVLEPPRLTGTAAVGRVLEVATGTWKPIDVPRAVQWVVGGQVVHGVTGPRFTPRPHDRGKPVLARVVALPAGLRPMVATTEPLLVAGPRVVVATAPPRVRGVRRVGRVLRATRGRWSPAPVSVRHRWFVGGRQVATGPRLRLRPVHAGGRVRLVAVATAPGLRPARQVIRLPGRVRP